MSGSNGVGDYAVDDKEATPFKGEGADVVESANVEQQAPKQLVPGEIVQAAWNAYVEADYTKGNLVRKCLGNLSEYFTAKGVAVTFRSHHMTFRSMGSAVGVVVDVQVDLVNGKKPTRESLRVFTDLPNGVAMSSDSTAVADEFQVKLECTLSPEPNVEGVQAESRAAVKEAGSGQDITVA